MVRSRVQTDSQVARKAQPVEASTNGKRGRKPIDPNETPEMRFKRIAGIRAAKVCKLLRGIGHCANTNLYSYTDKQVDFMFDLIEKAYNSAQTKYSEPVEARAKVSQKVDSIF